MAERDQTPSGSDVGKKSLNEYGVFSSEVKEPKHIVENSPLVVDSTQENKEPSQSGVVSTADLQFNLKCCP